MFYTHLVSAKKNERKAEKKIKCIQSNPLNIQTRDKCANTCLRAQANSPQWQVVASPQGSYINQLWQSKDQGVKRRPLTPEAPILHVTCKQPTSFLRKNPMPIIGNLHPRCRSMRVLGVTKGMQAEVFAINEQSIDINIGFSVGTGQWV